MLMTTPFTLQLHPFHSLANLKKIDEPLRLSVTRLVSGPKMSKLYVELETAPRKSMHERRDS